MIKELVNFTNNLDESFKNLGIKPKEGLHIMIQLVNTDNVWHIDDQLPKFEIYSKKTQESDFIKHCKLLSLNAWCINTNKCFDAPAKAIHSCSPFLVAFKREQLDGGAKFMENQSKNKDQIYNRFDRYFKLSFELLEEEDQIEKYKVFANFFIRKEYEKVLDEILSIQATKTSVLESELEIVEANYRQETDIILKGEAKNQIDNLKAELLQFKKLDDSEYILFYLDETEENYTKAHTKYISDNLFNTADYNTNPDEQGLIYGTSDFMNGFNLKMPFLKHKTASFDITNRISNVEAKVLNEFNQILGRKVSISDGSTAKAEERKVLPSPLPIFIFKEELNQRTIGIFKESGFKLSYKEIIENLLSNYSNDVGNYYLLNWVNTKEGIVFNDFDFVTKFDYEYKAEIHDLFEVNYSPKITNIFEFQNQILPVIFNNNLIVKNKDGKIIQKYFDEIESKYCKSALNQILILKYRKAFYDFVYKSKREAISQQMFVDMMKVSVLEDIRLDNIKNGKHTEYYNIRQKLNIWFSLYENFNNFNNHTNEKTMASKLKEYQEFVAQICSANADLASVTDEQFMFVAGQVIDYLMSKSKAADNSYLLLEPYTQKSNCKELQRAISTNFEKYKHANYSGLFEKAAAFVLTYETSANLKNYLPQLLAGVFAPNQLFPTKKVETTQEIAV